MDGYLSVLLLTSSTSQRENVTHKLFYTSLYRHPIVHSCMLWLTRTMFAVSLTQKILPKLPGDEITVQIRALVRTCFHFNSTQWLFYKSVELKKLDFSLAQSLSVS